MVWLAIVAIVTKSRVLPVAMAIHVWSCLVCTQLVKSVIDKLKYQLVFPPVMLMAVMAMEGEPRDIENCT